MKYLELLRPQQWLKNAFVFAPTFFAQHLTDPEILLKTLLAAFCFSMASSTIYILNDWVDREADALHPDKQHRPLASGAVSPSAAVVLAGFTLALALLPALFLSVPTLWVIGAYLVLNTAYSLKLKHHAVLDVACIATGFVLRLFAGSLATDIPLSPWIITLTFLLALFLALAKRRDDVLREERGEQRTRPSIAGYNQTFLNHAMSVMAAVVVVAYLMYCHAADRTLTVASERLFLTTGFVILGLLRYMQLAFVRERTGNPTRVLLKDRFTQVNLLAWAGAYAWMLYA